MTERQLFKLTYRHVKPRLVWKIGKQAAIPVVLMTYFFMIFFLLILILLLQTIYTDFSFLQTICRNVGVKFKTKRLSSIPLIEIEI